MKVMAKTIWVLRRIRTECGCPTLSDFGRSGAYGDLVTHEALRLSHFLRLFLFGAARAISSRAAVLLQFVVKRLQANAENLGGPGLIVVRGFERLQNQQALSFTHCGAHADPDGIAVIG